jgi:hypothetical protein
VVNIINAHDDFLVGHIEPNTEVDILISLGDLYDVTLQKDVDVYAPEHYCYKEKSFCRCCISSLGITVCLYAYSNLSFSTESQFTHTCAQQYHWLREYALDHDEAGDTFRAVD